MENVNIETTYISDTSVFNRSLSESVTSQEESLPNGVLRKVTGPIAEWGSLNRNKRMYTERLWDRVLNSSYLKEQLRYHTLYGEANHPEGRYEVDFERVSHSIVEMWKVPASNQVYATMYILDTPLGKIINTLYNAGGIIGYSTRAGGVLNKKKDYIEVDENTYNFITVDAVPYPSVEAARPGVNEGVEGKEKVSLSEDAHHQLKSIILESSNKDREVIKNLIYSLQSYDFSDEISLLESGSLNIDSSIQNEESFSVKKTTMFLLKESSAQIDNLKAENLSLKARLETVTSERDSIKGNLESSLRKITNLTSESKSYQDNVDNIQNLSSNTISSLNEKIKDLMSDIDERDIEIERYSEIEKAFNLLKEEKKVLVTKISESSQVNPCMESRLLDVSGRLSKSVDEIDSLNESISIVTRENMRLSNEIKDVQDKLNTSVLEADSYRMKLEKMQDSISEGTLIKESAMQRAIKENTRKYSTKLENANKELESLKRDLVSVISSSYSLTTESVMRELPVEFSKSDIYAVCERLHNESRDSGISYANVISESVTAQKDVKNKVSAVNRSVIGRGFASNRRGLNFIR